MAYMAVKMADAAAGSWLLLLCARVSNRRAVQRKPAAAIAAISTTWSKRKSIPDSPFGISGYGRQALCKNKLFFLPSQLDRYSAMHNAWMRTTCGRLKSDYRYSASIVYNNFPWPENPGGKQRQAVEAAAQAVLDARAQFPDSSLADLYDSLILPPVLLNTHRKSTRRLPL
jgi:hypothetical protein